MWVSLPNSECEGVGGEYIKKWMEVTEWDEARKVAYAGAFVGRDPLPSLAGRKPSRDLSPEG